MYLLYSALLALALLVSLPYWLLQALRQGKYRAGLRERLGRLPARLKLGAAQPTIWIHAVSVGEVIAVGGLIAELQRGFPFHRIMVSTTTDTGQKLARARFGEANVFYFPLDFAFAIEPYLEALRPELIVLTETEFWPNFLRLAHKYRSRIAVVNARISDRSWPGYRRWRRILAKLLRPVDLFLAQSEEDRRRLIQIGALENCIAVSGNLKFDASLPPPLPIVRELREKLNAENAGPVLVCGSTVEGEELILLEAFRQVLASHPHAVMLLAPRHPERFAEVEQLLHQSKMAFSRRSLFGNPNQLGNPNQFGNSNNLPGSIVLVDTIGELASLYALADLAFVGGSLVPRGGHNPLEPALHGIPVVTGPHTENFRDVVKSLKRREAVRVVGTEGLPQTLLTLLCDAAERARLGRCAAETVREHQGATQTTFLALKNLLERRSH